MRYMSRFVLSGLALSTMAFASTVGMTSALAFSTGHFQEPSQGVSNIRIEASMTQAEAERAKDLKIAELQRALEHSQSQINALEQDDANTTEQRRLRIEALIANQKTVDNMPLSLVQGELMQTHEDLQRQATSQAQENEWLEQEHTRLERMKNSYSMASKEYAELEASRIEIQKLKDQQNQSQEKISKMRALADLQPLIISGAEQEHQANLIHQQELQFQEKARSDIELSAAQEEIEQLKARLAVQNKLSGNYMDNVSAESVPYGSAAPAIKEPNVVVDLSQIGGNVHQYGGGQKSPENLAQIPTNPMSDPYATSKPVTLRAPTRAEDIHWAKEWATPVPSSDSLALQAVEGLDTTTGLIGVAEPVEVEDTLSVLAEPTMNVDVDVPVALNTDAPVALSADAPVSLGAAAQAEKDDAYYSTWNDNKFEDVNKNTNTNTKSIPLVEKTVVETSLQKDVQVKEQEVAQPSAPAFTPKGTVTKENVQKSLDFLDDIMSVHHKKGASLNKKYVPVAKDLADIQPAAGTADDIKLNSNLSEKLNYSKSETAKIEKEIFGNNPVKQALLANEPQNLSEVSVGYSVEKLLSDAGLGTPVLSPVDMVGYTAQQWVSGPLQGMVEQVSWAPSVKFDTLVTEYVGRYREDCGDQVHVSPIKYDRFSSHDMALVDVMCPVNENSYSLSLVFYGQKGKVFNAVLHTGQLPYQKEARIARDQVVEQIKLIKPELVLSSAL